jgi:hypothetical protein
VVTCTDATTGAFTIDVDIDGTRTLSCLGGGSDAFTCDGSFDISGIPVTATYDGTAAADMLSSTGDLELSTALCTSLGTADATHL